MDLPEQTIDIREHREERAAIHSVGCCNAAL